MSIKYEIHSIKNSQGTGEERNFARIFEHEPMTAKQLKSHIQASCSLTEGDVEATLSALREHMIHELSHGNRFYIPSIDYFSLSVDLDMPEGKPMRWLRHFTETGVLKKEGAMNSPVYFLEREIRQTHQ